MDHNLRCVFVANGEVEAQQVAAFLRAHGVEATLLGESTRKTHGLTLDGLGAAEICVAEPDEERARNLLQSVEAGKFRIGESKD